MSPTVNSITSFLARASPMHCLFPTPKGTRAGCLLYLREYFEHLEMNLILHLPSSPMNLSGLNISGLVKWLGSLMMKWRFDTNVEFGGNVKSSTWTEHFVW